MPNSDHPLLAIRLTILAPSNRCLLGISWAHILGDAFACNLSIRHLAWLYLKSGQEPNFDQPPLPTFFPHVKLPIDSFYPASADLERYKIHQITPSYPAAIASGMYKHNRLDSDGVLVSLTRKELEGMMREFKELAGDNGGQLSSLDVITGWWIGVLQRIGVEIHRVIYTINVSWTCQSSNGQADSYSTVHFTNPAITFLPIYLLWPVTSLKCLLSLYQLSKQARYLQPRPFARNFKSSDRTKRKD